jgi:hypothetical protein
MNRTIKNIVLIPMNILYKLNAKLTLRLLYRLKCGYRLDLKNPKTFNEKLQWIKLYYRYYFLPICADKYEVRQFVKNCGCEEILNKLLWEGYDPSSIPFHDLPEKFVIKVTHGQGYNIICKDKSILNIDKTKRQLYKWLNEKYLPCYGEWYYGIIKPKVIIEEYLDDGYNDSPYDYKVFCFHGHPKLIKVHIDRFTNRKSIFLDLDWNVVKDVSMKHLDSTLNIPKPKELEQLLEYAKKLSSKFIHVRVDFYIIKSKIYFGELTFTNGAGFDKISPREFDEMMGAWINLPIEQINY